MVRFYRFECWDGNKAHKQHAPVEVPRVVEGVDGGGEAAVEAEYPVGWGDGWRVGEICVGGGSR